jgi:hypothetical protein
LNDEFKLWVFLGDGHRNVTLVTTHLVLVRCD